MVYSDTVWPIPLNPHHFDTVIQYLRANYFRDEGFGTLDFDSCKVPVICSCLIIIFTSFACAKITSSLTLPLVFRGNSVVFLK